MIILFYVNMTFQKCQYYRDIPTKQYTTSYVHMDKFRAFFSMLFLLMFFLFSERCGHCYKQRITVSLCENRDHEKFGQSFSSTKYFLPRSCFKPESDNVTRFCVSGFLKIKQLLLVKITCLQLENSGVRMWIFGAGEQRDEYVNIGQSWRTVGWVCEY